MAFGYGCEGAGTMVIQIVVEPVLVPRVDGSGVLLGNVTVANGLADNAAVFGLDQSVVVMLAWPALTQRDAQFFEQFSHYPVNVLRAIVGMELMDDERERCENRLQHRQ